jgi:hypothetical protein
MKLAASRSLVGVVACALILSAQSGGGADVLPYVVVDTGQAVATTIGARFGTLRLERLSVGRMHSIAATRRPTGTMAMARCLI